MLFMHYASVFIHQKDKVDMTSLLKEITQPSLLKMLIVSIVKSENCMYDNYDQ